MSRITSTNARLDLSVHQTQTRVTPASTGQRFADALGQTVVRGVEQVAGIATGGSVSLAQRAGGASPESPGAGAAAAGSASGSLNGLMEGQTNSAMQLLELQQQISAEQRQYSTVSNVMKARHDTAKQVINNVR